MKEPTLNSADLLLLEQPILRVPYEQLRRNLKSAQRAIERDLTATCTSSLNDLAKGTPPASLLPKESAVQAIDAMLGRVRGLKRKLSSLSASNTANAEASSARIDHLATLHSLESYSSKTYREWADVRLSRQVAEYMLRKGYTQSADALATSYGVDKLVDTDLFKECARIEAALAKESVVEALTWCKENAPLLKKIKVSAYLHQAVHA